ncbi:hypothetical protein HAPAU_37450 [Halalkalicoccus paucihalophilus]|uniref:Uncharacterized protein n=1 Tax=Halalkalicoccus paucihalophilus TaxID=1008153 RepID=A0A151A9D5_9EURY|nr:hypothetical protein HAPAU_37450 [Halalkalicoccus paucihalophilus]
MTTLYAVSKTDSGLELREFVLLYTECPFAKT